jgi:hypothetical protein
MNKENKNSINWKVIQAKDRKKVQGEIESQKKFGDTSTRRPCGACPCKCDDYY